MTYKLLFSFSGVVIKLGLLHFAGTLFFYNYNLKELSNSFNQMSFFTKWKINLEQS